MDEQDKKFQLILEKVDDSFLLVFKELCRSYPYGDSVEIFDFLMEVFRAKGVEIPTPEWFQEYWEK